MNKLNIKNFTDDELLDFEHVLLIAKHSNKCSIGLISELSLIDELYKTVQAELVKRHLDI